MKRRSLFNKFQDSAKTTRILRPVAEILAGHAIYLCLLFALLLQPLLPLLASRVEAATPKLSSTPGRAIAPPLQTTIYGPVRFDRQAGTAENVIGQFSVPGTLAASYMLRIENGTSGAANRATGVILLLNGTLLTTSRLFDNGVAALDIPVQLLSNNELSIRVTGAPGSYVTVSVFNPSSLSITSLNPTSGFPGATVTISGSGFKPEAPNQNVAYFTATGGGFVFAPITAYTSTSLTVTVPADAVTGPVKVQTPDGSVVSAQSFTIVSGPYISGFTPTSGPIGTTVTITGTNLKPDSSAPAVTFTGSNNARIPALVSSSTATQVQVTVPNGVITGPIELTTSAGKTTSTSVFSVQASQDFAITLAPATAMALQGGQATFLLTLTSDDPNFTQLATLSAPSLPSGIKASFNPAQITAGGSSTVTMVIPGNISSGGYDFTFEAKALVDGSEKSKTTNGSVTVNIAAQTTLSGRVLANDSVPIHGATVSIDGLTAVTDSAGNFLLSGLTAGTERPLMVDGRTAYAPNRSYPVIAEPVTIVAGQANVVPYTFYLPVVDTASEVPIVPSVTTNVTTPQVPGLTMTIPANAGLVNRDGTPVTRASITPVEIDRTPAPLPSNVGTAIVYTAQPGGARPANGIVVPVKYPNLGGANPGTRLPLWNFNHDTVQWYIYGYGVVSSDGRMIEPEPGVGLPDFSWHFAGPDSPCPNCCSQCPCPTTPNPVDLSSGIKYEYSNDLVISGQRGSIGITRIYSTTLVGTCDNCPFGRGTTHNYDFKLSGTFQLNGSGRFHNPGDDNGFLFSYSYSEGDGSLIFTNSGNPSLIGDKIVKKTNGNLEYIKKSGNRVIFNQDKKPLNFIDRRGNVITLAYQNGMLSSITDPVNRSINLYYAGNRITQLVDSAGRTLAYTYDGGNRLTSVKNPNGHYRYYLYDLFSRLISVADNNRQGIKIIEYDGNNRVSKQVQPDGYYEEYAYALSGNTISFVTITDSTGRNKSFRFNGQGQIIETINENGQKAIIRRDFITNLTKEIAGSCGCPEERNTYDSSGNIITSTNADNITSTYEYDQTFNLPTKSVKPNGRVTTNNLDAFGNIIKQTDALNNVTIYQYDQHSQITKTTNALNQHTHYEYNLQGDMVALIDNAGNRYSREYDNLSRLISTTDPLSRQTRYTYDNVGNITSITDPAGAATTYTYDWNNNVVSVTNTLNQQTTYSYDTKNRLTHVTDANGNTSKLLYNKRGQITHFFNSSVSNAYRYTNTGKLLSINYGDDRLVRYYYNNRDDLTTIVYPNGGTASITYDSLSRAIATTDPLGRTAFYAYDDNNNMVMNSDRMGRKIILEYNVLNRLIKVNYPDAVVEYLYNSVNKLTRVSDTTGSTVNYEYDSTGQHRVISESTPTDTISTQFNAAGQRTLVQLNGQVNSFYEYDQHGRISKIKKGLIEFNYSYDSLSRISTLSRSNGVNTQYTYDPVGKTSKIEHKNINGTVLNSNSYLYGSDGKIDLRTSSVPSVALPAGRVFSNANLSNRIFNTGDNVYEYNDEGQIVSKLTSAGKYTYGWDSRGRLINVNTPSQQRVRYDYDVMGRKVKVTTNNSSKSTIYDSINAIKDIYSNGNWHEYLNGPGVDNKLLQTTNSTNTLYYLNDHVNSVDSVADASGNILSNAYYEPFGRRVYGGVGSFGFTGREHDDASQLIDYRARWLDPELGRFMSEDPLALFSDQDNLYSYVHNNPVVNTDPFGLFSCDTNCSIILDTICYVVEKLFENKLLVALGRAGIVVAWQVTLALFLFTFVTCVLAPIAACNIVCAPRCPEYGPPAPTPAPTPKPTPSGDFFQSPDQPFPQPKYPAPVPRPMPTWRSI